jgi:oxygen-dependent protoporphyrinogen oxidase
MAENHQSFEQLAGRARETHVVVVGGGVGGLVAALECAKVGMRVTVLEASDRLGGLIRSADVAGLTVDVGAESFATRGGHVRSLALELGLGDEIVTPQPGGAWLAGLPGGAAAPLPKGGLLGIPESPFTEDVRRIIGWNGAWRAYVDRMRPVLTIGNEQSLGGLVRARMGELVLSRLVAPITSGVYSADPDDIDIELAAPGLNAALTRTGSLSGAVALLRGSRTEAPGSAVEGISGGMSRLIGALESRLTGLGAEIRVGSLVRSVTPVPPAASGAAASAAAPPGSDGWIVRTAAEDLHADRVVIAASESAARELLAAHIGAPDPDRRTPRVHVVTLVLDAPALDDAPRGSGVLTVPGSHRAKALTHATVKWPWLAAVASAGGPHRHVVRVSFGSQSEPPATEGLDLERATEVALAEASALLGVPLEREQVLGSDIARYEQTLPGAAIGQRDAATAIRRRLEATSGLVAVGAWLSGTGLAQVVPDARAQAEILRRRALFGASPA